MVDQRLRFVGPLPHLQTGFSLHTPFQDVEMEFPQLLADSSLPSEESGGEIAADHAFDVQDSEYFWYLGADVFWAFANDGIGQVMSLNAFGINTEHTVHDCCLFLNSREIKFLLVCEVGCLLGPAYIFVSALLDQEPERRLMKQVQEQEQAFSLSPLSCGPNSGTEQVEEPQKVRKTVSGDPSLLPKQKIFTPKCTYLRTFLCQHCVFKGRNPGLMKQDWEQEQVFA